MSTSDLTVLELPGLVPIGHVSVVETEQARVERWSVAPGALVWFTSLETGAPMAPRAVQLRAANEPPPLAPAGTYHATVPFTPLPVESAEAEVPRVFRMVVYEVHDGEAYTSLALPVRGRLFRSAIGLNVQEWWFLHADYARPAGSRVTELRPARLPWEAGPRRAAVERLWSESRGTATVYAEVRYRVGLG